MFKTKNMEEICKNGRLPLKNGFKIQEKGFKIPTLLTKMVVMLKPLIAHCLTITTKVNCQMKINITSWTRFVSNITISNDLSCSSLCSEEFCQQPDKHSAFQLKVRTILSLFPLIKKSSVYEERRQLINFSLCFLPSPLPWFVVTAVWCLFGWWVL